MKKTKKEDSQYKWVLTVFVTAVVLSAVLSLVSESILDSTDIAVAVLTLTLFIGLGIVFDVIGVAATALHGGPSGKGRKGGTLLTAKCKQGVQRL